MSCSDCLKGSVLEGKSTGVMVQGAYFATGATSDRAIILLTDIFGLSLNNSQILADNFEGRPPVTVEQMNTLPDRAGAKMSFLDTPKLVLTVLPSLPALIRNRAAVVDARTISFIKKLQEEKKHANLGAIGYCFGGGIATRVGTSTAHFNSIVLVHPSPPRTTISQQ
ncbi:hypothetical protein B0H19DRAFT_1260807 [Mycena capillaripes]|nr:hypothetical protein B0H19DRAFT_1260807 [Mycena capillaripes]